MTPLKGKGWMGWLGRQIGYVRHAINTDVAKDPQTTDRAAEESVLYRHDEVIEAAHPENPNLQLRRTVIDEVIEKGPKQTDLSEN